MRYLSLFIVVSLALTFCINDVFAQSSETEALKNKVEMFEKELKEIKDLLKQQIVKDSQKEREIVSLKEKDVQKEKDIASLKEVDIKKEKDIASLKEEVKKKELAVAPEGAAGEEFYFAKKKAELDEKGLAPAFEWTYTKPFLRRFGRNTYLGGYMDFVFRQEEEKGTSPLGRRSTSHGFDQGRFIPFIFSDISDRVKLAAEIEIEHGGVDNDRLSVGGGKVIMEFATIDFC